MLIPLSHSLLPLLLLPTALSLVPTPIPPTTTPPPLPRHSDDPAALIGFFTDPSAHTWTSSACPAGLTYSTEGRFGGCCASTRTGPRCALATACADNIAVFPDGGSGVCRSNQQCDSITIREFTTGAAAQTMISCVETTNLFSQPNTLFRQTFTFPAPIETVTATQTATTTTTTTTAARTGTGESGDGGDEEGGAAGGTGAVVIAVVVAAAGAAMAIAL